MGIQGIGLNSIGIQRTGLNSMGIQRIEGVVVWPLVAVVHRIVPYLLYAHRIT